MDEKKTWDLISIASIPLVMTLGNSMLIPVLPIMEKKLAISPLQASMVITVYSVVAILFIPIAGFLSDRMGRKVIIIPSLIIAGLGGLLSGWAAWKMSHPYFMILAGRLLQGIGAAGAFPIVMPLIGDMFQRKSEVSAGLGFIETSNTFGKVLSPVLGAVLASLLWYIPFFSTPVFCLISALLVAFFVKTPKEKKAPKDFKSFKASIAWIFQTEGRWLYAIFSIGCISMIAFSGMLLLSGSILWISFSNGIYLLIFALSLSGIGIGGALPSLDALITQGFGKEERGTITSLYNSARFIGVALGPPVFAFLIKFSHKTLFFSVAGACIAAAILSLFAIKPPGKPPTKGTIFSTSVSKKERAR